MRFLKVEAAFDPLEPRVHTVHPEWQAGITLMQPRNLGPDMGQTGLHELHTHLQVTDTVDQAIDPCVHPAEIDENKALGPVAHAATSIANAA